MLSALVHLFYPHCCENCGNDLARHEEVLCMRCYLRLPVTGFHRLPENPVERLFYGRFPVQHASSAYYFGKQSQLQQLIHAFKYQGRKDIALYLGRQMGLMLKESSWVKEVTAVVPVPLYKSRQKKRGYNQAALLASGLCEVTGNVFAGDVLVRKAHTATQTHKSRGDRWENVSDVFCSDKGNCLEEQHVLLVDDVLTTGATLEACAQSLKSVKGVKISVCSLAYTSK